MKQRFFYLLMFLFFCYSQYAYSESYTLNVGQSLTISQTAFSGGYIDNVGLADYIDPHLEFTNNFDGTATITVNSYFDYTATVKLVFIERYQAFYSGRYHTRAQTYYKDVSIKCNYQKPDPSLKPTKVILPERIRVSINDSRLYITPILEPYGAKGTDYYWSNIQGTSVYSMYSTGEGDGSCWVKGKTPGIGWISVVVDGDRDNLYASTVLEVVDPEYLPPSSVFLPSEIEISVDGSANLTPTLVPENSSTSFTWESEDESIASVSFGKVTGKKVGTTTITLSTYNFLKATCIVKVVSSDGKDDEEEDGNYTGGTIDGYEYVDLGLSVKWATFNVGANSSEEFGNYYAWGETTTKSSYSWSNYIYCGGSIMNVYDIGSDIKGTSYDAAYVKWGSNWRMPNQTEMGELISKCTFKEEVQNGVDGYMVTGPNGNSIFLPNAGYTTTSNYKGCRCWTATSDGDYAMSLLISSGKPTLRSQMRMYGIPIRAVSTATGTPSCEPTIVSLPTSKSLYTGETSTLLTTLSPLNSNTTLNWSSDDTSIATVTSTGIIKGIKEGSTKIRVYTSNGKTDCCNITVKKLSGIEINETNFPDENFLNYLLSQNYGSDGVLTKEEIAEIKILSANSKNIQDLTGIENFIALQYLYCDNNKLTSIDVSNNTALRELDCSYNQISTLDLTNNKELTTLLCYSNQLNGKAMDGLIVSLPTASNNEMYVIFNENENNIMNSTQVAAAKAKGWIPKYTIDGRIWLNYAGSEPIIRGDVNCDGIVNGTDIQAVINAIVNGEYDEKADVNEDETVNGTDIQKIINYIVYGPDEDTGDDDDSDDEDAGSNPVVEGIVINEKNFPDTNLRNWIKSQEYGSDGLLMEDEIATIKSIDVNNKNIQTLQGIEFFTSLTILYCYDNQLTSLDVSQNTALTLLNCSNNQLKSLDVANNTGLTKLYCNNNHLILLDLSKNKALTLLNCSSNQIQGIAMDALIASLPTINIGKMYAVNNENESNIVTMIQVAAAKAKGWTPYYYDNSSWKDYDYPICPDDQHPHMIDLGLPSGTKWACCNVGASKPENYGNYYAWGETTTKSSYNWNKYKYGYYDDFDYDNYSQLVNIGTDIAGTKKDAATVNWGEPWRMPNITQIKELLRNTTKEWITVNGIYGCKFTSTNGCSIFVPAAGYRINTKLEEAGKRAEIWSSSLDESAPNHAYVLFLDSDIRGYSASNRCHGQSIRPVCK